MKNFKRTGLALFLVLSILVTMLSGMITVNAAQGTPATEVYYCGAKLDATNKYLFYDSLRNTAAASTETLSGHTQLAVFENGVLKFTSGFDLDSNDGWNTMINMVQDSTDNNYYGIKANGDLTIDLGTYSSFLYIDWHLPTTSEVHAVEVDGDLTITGTTGILKLSAYMPMNSDNATNLTSYGIKASGDVKLLGGTVHIYDRHYDSTTKDDKVICISSGGKIYLDGATVKLYSRNDTLFTHFSPEPELEGYTSEQHLDKQPNSRGNLTEGSTNNTNNLTLTPPTGETGGDDGEEGEGGQEGGIIDEDEANLPTPETRPDATEIYYCGVKLDTTNKYLLATNDTTKAPKPLASSTETKDGYVLIAEFDAKTGTLTYKGGYDAALSWNSQMDMVQLEENGTYYGIKANGNLIIDLGRFNNHLFLDWKYPQGAPLHAIDVDGKLTVKGKRGSLKLGATPVMKSEAGTTFKSYGIKTYGDINLEGGTIHIYEGHYTPNAINEGSTSTYISAGGGNIYIDGAIVKMRARKATPGIKHFGKEPIISEGYTQSDNSNIEITDSIGTEGTTTDNKNNLTLTPPEKEEGDQPIVDGPAQEMYYCGAVLNAENPYLLVATSAVGGAKVKASSKKSEVGYILYATFENGRFTYCHGYAEELGWNSYIDMVLDEEDGIYRGIKANGDLIIDVGTYHNFLFLNWRYPQGAPLYAIEVNGNLTIRGTTGTLKMCATPTLNSSAGTEYKSYGIKASGDVRLNGGTVHVFEGHYNPDKVNEGSTTTYISAGGDIYADGAKIKMRARKSTPGITHFNKEPIISEGYVKTTEENIEVNESIGTEISTTGNKNNLTLTPPPKQNLIVGGANLYKDKPYLVKNGEAWIETDVEDGAYAIYDFEKGTLTFTEDVKLNATMNALTNDGSGETIYTYNCILADMDIEIVIPENVKITLAADKQSGISRAIWAGKNIKISGGGTVDAYAGPSKKDGDYLSGALWAEGKVIIDGVTAILHTVKAESNGKSGHVIYGGDGIEITNGATVYAGTDLGKLCNVAPEIYDEADVLMAEDSTGDYNKPVAGSDLIAYDKSKVTSMKYLQAVPKRMVVESVGGYGINGDISLAEPVIEYVFNYEIAEEVSKENITVTGGATVESVIVEGKVLKIKLGNVTENGKYTISLSNIANSLGTSYSGKATFDVSEVNVKAIKLNGSAEGTVKNGDNAIEVTVSSSKTQEVMVITTVWSRGTYAKKLKTSKSVIEKINGEQTITVNGVTASSGDVIQVMIWDGAGTRNVLKKSVKFGN